MKKNKNPVFFRNLLLLAGMMPLFMQAQETQAKTGGGYTSNPLFLAMLAVIVLLTILIIALGNALKTIIGSDMFTDKLKKEKAAQISTKGKITGLFMFFSLISLSSYAQEKAAVVKAVHNDSIGGLSHSTFYVMLIIIIAELLVITVLLNTFKTILGKQQAKKKAAEVKTKSLFDQLNDTVAIENEESIMLDHDYDGIKELDNNLPPWWKWGFYLTIVVAFIYMINYHITKTSPLQKQEYANELKKAKEEIDEYMKTSANNVDENTVKVLTEKSDIEAGKEIFMATCAACHGRAGEGGVGPNLTDDYWMHGGSIQDVFKTIKYGWPDKGMKSWKEEYSPMQIAQLASFLRTFKGTNPANAKEKQGDLYTEGPAAKDSTAVKTDTSKVIAADLPK